MIGLSKREFHGKEFYAFCQRAFDEARKYLKTCGKPKTDLDFWWISYHKETVRIFSKFLD